MKRLALLFFSVATLFSCSSDEDQDPIEYIKSVDGYWVRTESVTTKPQSCNLEPPNPVTFIYKAYYKFNFDNYLWNMYWHSGRRCGYENGIFTLMSECKDKFGNREMGFGGYVGSNNGNTIVWDNGDWVVTIILSSDRKSFTYTYKENYTHISTREEGTYALVSSEDAIADLNKFNTCP
tara:strand:- start:550 stop:1086 length:537 start_codon:yes stop_codon:yes gene_type:complete